MAARRKSWKSIRFIVRSNAQRSIHHSDALEKTDHTSDQVDYLIKLLVKYYMNIFVTMIQ